MFVDTLKFYELLRIFGPCLVQSYLRIFRELNGLLQSFIARFSNIEFTDLDNPLQLSRNGFPLLIQSQTLRAIGLIEVDDPGFPVLQEEIPVVHIQDNSVWFESQSLFVLPFFLGTFFLYGLELLGGLELFGHLAPGLHHFVHIVQHELHNAFRSHFWLVKDWRFLVACVQHEGLLFWVDGGNFEEAWEDWGDLLQEGQGLLALVDEPDPFTVQHGLLKGLFGESLEGVGG